MRRFLRTILLLSALSGCGSTSRATLPTSASASASGVAVVELLPPSAFDSINDKAVRSRALFAEASKVFFSPRCANCHPNGDAPTQRDNFERHDPPVQRGEHDRGIPGLTCTSCHQDSNAKLARVPGAPKWQLAPLEMSWQGRSAHQICEQIKDLDRNGHRSLDAVAEHVAHDPLVGWGWHPGADRSPAPGTQEAAGALVSAWVATGAECPVEDGKKVVDR